MQGKSGEEPCDKKKTKIFVMTKDLLEKQIDGDHPILEKAKAVTAALEGFLLRDDLQMPSETQAWKQSLLSLLTDQLWSFLVCGWSTMLRLKQCECAAFDVHSTHKQEDLEADSSQADEQNSTVM